MTTLTRPAHVDRHTAQFENVTMALLAALEAYDVDSSRHSRAVASLCGRMAKAMKLNGGDQQDAITAGALHDVGKISVSRGILLKRASLTADEWVRMQSHATIGARMLEEIPALRKYAAIVRAHHERIDGTGYPDGIAGSSIPLLARIVAVGDSFHAMISKRPYRTPLSIPAAVAELRRGRGTQWDEAIVDVFLHVLGRAESPRAIRIASRA